MGYNEQTNILQLSIIMFILIIEHTLYRGQNYQIQ